MTVSPAGGSHWPDKENHLFTLEATGYALLALVKLGHQKEAAAAFNWLNEKRRRGGGFGSTQVPAGGAEQDSVLYSDCSNVASVLRIQQQINRQNKFR